MNRCFFSAPGWHRAAALALVAIVLGACGSPRRGEPLSDAMALATDSLQRGRIAYDRHCLHCHGNGEGAMAPAINDKPLPKALIRMQIRRGFGAMPAFSEQELSDRDVEAIADYLVALRKHGR